MARASSAAADSGGAGGAALPDLRALSPEGMGALKVPELKELLRLHGCKVSGNKAQLIERLTEYKASL